MKKCLFFPVTGNYDEIRKPTVITHGWDYICFTDNKKLKSDFWDIRFIENKDGLSSVKQAKRVFIMFHDYVGDYDLSISTGAQMQATCNLDTFINTFLPKDDAVDMSMARHPNRICTYQEADKCISKRHDDPAIIKKQMDFYKQEGFPENNGLVATGIIIRKHHRDNVEKHCEKWWEQMYKYSCRDQLGFNYVLWKHNLVNINYFDYGVIRGVGNYFKKHAHRVKR